MTETSQGFTRIGYVYARVAGPSSLRSGSTVVLEAYANPVCHGHGFYFLAGLHFGYTARGKLYFPGFGFSIRVNCSRST
jgi:hypothetical protein